MRGQAVMGGGFLGSPSLLAPDWAPLKYQWQDGGVKGPCLPQPQQAARAGTGCGGLDTTESWGSTQGWGVPELSESQQEDTVSSVRISLPFPWPKSLIYPFHEGPFQSALLSSGCTPLLTPLPLLPLQSPWGFSYSSSPGWPGGGVGLVPEAQVWGLAPAREGSPLRPPHGRGEPGPGQRGSRESGPAARDGRHLLV